MLPGFCNDTVTRWRAPLVDSRGTKIRDWSQASKSDVTGCSLQPSGASGTYGEQRNGAEYDAVLYMPPGADVEKGDRVEFAGATYSLEGGPQEWRSPTGRVTHKVVNLKEWRG